MKTNSTTRSALTRGVLPTTPVRLSAGATLVHAHLFEVDIDRRKPIDRYIDYFGGGGAGHTVATAHPRGGSLPGSGGAL